MSTGNSFRTPSAERPEGLLSPAVLSDFDDTAAEQNVAELLLERFGHDSWRDVRNRFREGQLTLKEYQEITFRHISADRASMRDYVMEKANFRPYFHELCGFCQQRDIPLAIVSQGLDFYIQALLDKEGLSHVPVYAVNTVFSAERLSYIYNFPYPGREDLGNSKGVLVDRFRNQGNYVFYAGDGASDLEAAERADVVFAHRTLAQQCRERQIPFQDFDDFQGMLQAVELYSRKTHSH